MVEKGRAIFCLFSFKLQGRLCTVFASYLLHFFLFDYFCCCCGCECGELYEKTWKKWEWNILSVSAAFWVGLLLVS